MAEELEDALREFERRRPIATLLAVSLTHQFPGRDRQVSELLSSFLALRFSDEPPVDPTFVLMHAFLRIQSTTKAKPLVLALALVNSPDTWNLLSPQAILEWALFWARRSWPRAKEWVSEPVEPALFHRLVRGAPFEIEDAPAYADLLVACLTVLAKNRDPTTEDVAAVEETFLSTRGLGPAAARLRAFRRGKKRAPGRAGRPRTVPTTVDTTILKRWNPKRYASYAELARELDTEAEPVTGDRVRRVLERARMAKLRRLRRTNPPSSP